MPELATIWSIGGDEYVTSKFVHVEMNRVEITLLASRNLMCMFYGSIIVDVENCDNMHLLFHHLEAILATLICKTTHRHVIG
jgi:hypothetical protein